MSVQPTPSIRVRALAAALAVTLSASALPASAQQARVNDAGMQANGKYDRFIIKYRNGSAAQTNPAALARSLQSAVLPQGRGRSRSKGMSLAHVRRIATGAELVSASRPMDRAEAASVMRQLASDPSVEYVEVDRLYQPSEAPNDPDFRQQWGLKGLNGIEADKAWSRNNGNGTVVAVLDSGIARHSDLDRNVLVGYDFISRNDVSNDGNGRDADPSDPGNWVRAGQCGEGAPARDSTWHGTHVAGIIAATAGNSEGIAGVAHGAKIVPVRVLGTCGGFESDIADAIVWASGGTVTGVPDNANPAEVINMSLGVAGACSATIRTAITAAVGRGTTVVAAAGNDSTDMSGHTPSNCNNVIAVAATNRLGRRAPFSNYGAGIDVAAPGVDILSTLNSGRTRPGDESYESRKGTSMAAPHVSGVVAMIQSVSSVPMTPAQVEALLKATASRSKSLKSKPIGAGIVNAEAALNAASSQPSVTPPQPPAAPPDPPVVAPDPGPL